MGKWTLFSNHGHVLVCLARNNEARLRDVAADVGITERAVQKIVRELQDARFITISKHGRCNRYRINSRKALRHDLESHCTVGKLLQLLVRTDTVESEPAAADSVVSVPKTEKPAKPESAPAAVTPDKKEQPVSVDAGAGKAQPADTQSVDSKKPTSKKTDSKKSVAKKTDSAKRDSAKPDSMAAEVTDDEKPDDRKTSTGKKPVSDEKVPDPDQQGSLF